MRISLGAAPDALDDGLSNAMRFVFSSLEALTALRLLRIARHTHGGHLLLLAVGRSTSALIVPMYLLAICCVFFGGLVFACESRLATADATVLSVPDAIWLMFVTMTTVGYGDFSPVSDAGKVVAALATLAGLVTVAMPIAIVGENFKDVWQTRLLEYVLGKMRDQLHVRAVADCVHAFQTFDVAADGWIDWTKFKRGVRRSLKVRLGSRLHAHARPPPRPPTVSAPARAACAGARARLRALQGLDSDR